MAHARNLSFGGLLAACLCPPRWAVHLSIDVSGSRSPVEFYVLVPLLLLRAGPAPTVAPALLRVGDWDLVRSPAQGRLHSTPTDPYPPYNALACFFKFFCQVLAVETRPRVGEQDLQCSHCTHARWKLKVPALDTQRRHDLLVCCEVKDTAFLSTTPYVALHISWQPRSAQLQLPTPHRLQQCCAASSGPHQQEHVGQK